MEDEQGTVAQSPQQEAVDAEFARIIRVAEGVFAQRASGYRPWLYRIIRTLRPDMTRARWRELAGVVPDMSMSPDSAGDPVDAVRLDRWLRDEGHATCCEACNRQRLSQLMAQGVVPPWETGEAPAERTCACDGCTDERCQGDCESCDDHGCEQCYSDHGTYDCCGYCPDCDTHPNQSDASNYSRCAECDHCSECEHYCR